MTDTVHPQRPDGPPTGAGSSAAAAAPPRPRAASAGWTRNGALVTGLVLAGVVVVVAVVAPFVYGTQATALTADANLGSVPGHPLGTDSLGRDMLARTLVATRLTVVMALVATALAALVGIGAGVAVQLAPRPVRELGLRAVEFAVAYPTLLVAITVAAVLGKGATTVVVAIAVANVAGFARLTANLAAGLAHRDFVTTARLVGVPPVRLAVRHVLPNMAEPLLILVAQAFAGALVEISGLSFVGLGSQTPAFDLGTLLDDALGRLGVNPVLVAGPAAALFVTSLAALLIGDGLAAAANPRSSAARARVVRSGTSPVPSGTTAADASGREPLLVLEDLTVTHATSGRVLVHDVSLTVGRGEILGVVGESGSGKSLTASVVGRLLGEGLQARVGRLTLGGTDLLGDVPARELATRISFVYQDPGTALNPALHLGAQLTDVLRVHRGRTRAQARADLVAAFRRVLLPDPAGRLGQHPHQLSGGMKQRAMIASAMAVGPDLLIADEPTTALDVTVQREVLQLVRRLNREQGTAVLFISHDIGVVRALCDRVVVMKDGTVVERVDDPARLHVDTVSHPYTRRLLAATPTVRADAAPGTDPRTGTGTGRAHAQEQPA